MHFHFHFHLIMAAKEIEAFLVVPVHLLITEIMFLPFDSLRERLASYDNNNFCVECRGGVCRGVLATVWQNWSLMMKTQSHECTPP